MIQSACDTAWPDQPERGNSTQAAAFGIQFCRMHDDQTDEVLMQRYAAGDMAAFETLYTRHRRGLYAFISRQSPQPAWVDDIFQDTWLAVTRARQTYQSTAQFRTWLYQIARHRLIDLIRQRDPLKLAELEADEEHDAVAGIASDRPGPDQQLEAHQQHQRLNQALAALPANQREAFLLREHGELSIDDIAQLTGVSTETAKSRLRYAIAKLKSALMGSV
ncbi:RNA polymerase sigma-70 factor (ECF subfamily) [Chitinivorax tropicus]|uniref:RNA polymerase sigma-70 factor (ECF subfamily) n=1 Tax=Chitinivorax tropicus TaxID=714531 RepID=A0A840MVF8_9PROT|nr:RNA polymerase sigma factor [Chitinivorax tropicus]MBB5020323.1 RNA polymerase sigma-70 factor (ECF subfamily) [Chitinivorax tropicus]